MGSGTGCAGTLVTEIRQRVFAPVAVLPVDLDTLRFRDRDVFGVDVSHVHYCTRSTSRTPEMRRREDTIRSSCFLSRISAVNSTTAPSVLPSFPRASRLRILLCSANRTLV